MGIFYLTVLVHDTMKSCICFQEAFRNAYSKLYRNSNVYHLVVHEVQESYVECLWVTNDAMFEPGFDKELVFFNIYNNWSLRSSQ